jgi:hypothetical protein
MNYIFSKQASTVVVSYLPVFRGILYAGVTEGKHGFTYSSFGGSKLLVLRDTSDKLVSEVLTRICA